VSSGPARLAIRTALVVAGATLLARLWFVAHRALDLDEFEHAHAAWSVARGLLPYRDFFEHHSPGLYLLFAPLFGTPALTTDAKAALDALMLARGTMWLLTAASIAIVYRLASLVGNRIAAAFAVVLLATSSQFLESMLEFRPDVPAVLCLLLAIWCLTAADGRDDALRAGARLVAAGCAFGAALLFTQKVLFAAPGLGLALVIRRRATPATLFTTGALAPILATMIYFERHGALAEFWYYAVTINGRLNGDRFSPIPRLLSNVVQQPAIYVLGAIAITVRLQPDTTGTTVRLNGEKVPVVSGFSRTVILYTALSLVAGIFIIGRAHDQYYALLLPLLAVLGGLLAADWIEPTRPRRPLIAAAVSIALAAWCTAISARRFAPIDPQIDEIAFVTQQTQPSDSYVGGSPGAALFRPHGWYFCFLTGPFASDGDYTTLLHSLESGRVRPRLVVRDRYLAQRAPAALLAYIDAHYQHARGDLYLRQSEYGSASLNTSEASDRLDRPFTR